ncbi:MAG: hypothetical protein K6360_09045 [Deltaproteobacteria bacterium]
MEIAEFLQAMRDPSGIPFHPLVFQILMVLTFALHIMFVNFVVGGAFISLWGRIRGGHDGMRLSRALAQAVTIMLSVAIVLGVAPLLFVQVIYDPFWYTASVMSAWWTMGFLLAIGVAFYAFYGFYLGSRKTGGNVLWSIIAIASVLVSAVIIHALSVEQLQPDKWREWLVNGLTVDVSGHGLYAFELPRILHFIVPSFAMAGIFLMLYAWYFRDRVDYNASYVDFVASLGARLAFWGTAVQAAVGIWWVLTIPKALEFIYNPFFLVGAVSGLLLLFYLSKARQAPVEYAVNSALFALGTILLMSYAREALRMAYLGGFGYSIFDYRVVTDWGSTVLFFATFLGGLVVVAYTCMVAFQAGKGQSG